MTGYEEDQGGVQLPLGQSVSPPPALTSLTSIDAIASMDTDMQDRASPFTPVHQSSAFQHAYPTPPDSLHASPQSPTNPPFTHPMNYQPSTPLNYSWATNPTSEPAFAQHEDDSGLPEP
ncbi:hypothetical protein LTS18_006785, partial [Coniosporium uncinatum]